MRYYSECCSAAMPNWPEIDLCPKCQEHTDAYDTYEEDEEDEDIPCENDELNDIFEPQGIQEVYDAD
jgi:hypothetical protein